MQKVSNEIEIIRQLFGSLSEKDKKTFIKSIKFQDEPSKSEAIKREITHCPHCNSTEFSKNGKVSGFQRFICKECGKTFGTRNRTIFYAVKKDMEAWKQYIHCMIEKYSLRKVAKIDLVYIDPPFNTGQDFSFSKTRTASISNSKSDELAYSDSFKLDEYLKFMQERLYIIHKLLSDCGTLYLHIDIKMGHYFNLF